MKKSHRKPLGKPKGESIHIRIDDLESIDTDDYNYDQPTKTKDDKSTTNFEDTEFIPPNK